MAQDIDRKQLEAELDTTEKAFWHYTRSIEQTEETIKDIARVKGR